MLPGFENIDPSENHLVLSDTVTARYKAVIGVLLYIAGYARPDTAYAV